MTCAFSAVAVPRRQVDPLAVAPFVEPVPRLRAGDGAWARPLGLTDLVAPRGVPDLYQAQVLHLVRVRGGVGVGARVGARATVRASQG